MITDFINNLQSGSQLPTVDYDSIREHLATKVDSPKGINPSRIGYSVCNSCDCLCIFMASIYRGA
ncbi:hypothetical protein ESCOCK434M_20625 [Escherichia coli]|jgi:hypothetical protein